MKKIISILYVSFMALAILSSQPSYSQSENVLKAPSFELNDMEGEVVHMSDFMGKYLVIHIATTWCPYCNAEAPHLEELAQSYSDKGVRVLIIDVKEPFELVQQQLVEKHQLTFPVLLDVDGSVASLFAPEDVLPELARDEIMLASNLVINPEGNIIFMSLLDTRNFDSRLITIKAKLDELLSENK